MQKKHNINNLSNQDATRRKFPTWQNTNETICNRLLTNESIAKPIPNEKHPPRNPRTPRKPQKTKAKQNRALLNGNNQKNYKGKNNQSNVMPKYQEGKNQKYPHKTTLNITIFRPIDKNNSENHHKYTRNTLTVEIE